MRREVIQSGLLAILMASATLVHPNHATLGVIVCLVLIYQMMIGMLVDDPPKAPTPTPDSARPEE